MAAVALIFCALAAFDRPSQLGDTADLTYVAKLNPDHVSRIELTHATVKTVLKRDELTEDWAVTSPIQQEADNARIAHLLAAFRRPIVTDVAVDDGQRLIV